MFDTAKFGAFIAKLRKSADMTQSELADRLNLTRQAISRYECGDSFPDISVVRDIAAIFRIPLGLLINAGDPTEGEAEIIDAVAAGRDVSPKNASDVVNLAPLLKPSVLERLSESLSRQGISITAVLSLAEYLDETGTEKLMKSATFDSLADMDPNLLERLMPLLGPYTPYVVFQKILDGELDYHYIDLLPGSLTDAIEAAVVFGALDADALNIMRRSYYNGSRMNRRGVIRLFSCPKCGGELLHFYPHRCGCGYQPIVEDNILRLAESKARTPLIDESRGFETVAERFGSPLLTLILGAENLSGAIDYSFERDPVEREFVVLDDSPERLAAAERAVRPKNYARMLFALDNLAEPHILPENFDLIIDNTAERLGGSDTYLRLLRKGGCVVRDGRAVIEK